MSTSHPSSVFDAAQAEFAALSPRLWEPLGALFVGSLHLAPGEWVLDVCSGMGASALPAARAVGPAGRVDAVDLAAGLVRRGRDAAIGLPQLRFFAADATAWPGDPDRGYDAVLSGFGVFFLPDMDAACRRLVGLLAPGGRFAVQTWRHTALRTYAGALVAAVEHERGQPLPGPQSGSAAERIDTEDGLRAWLESLGLTRTWAVTQPCTVPMTPELAWDLVLGTGFRGLLGGLDEAARDRVRRGLVERLADRGVRSLDAGSVVGVGARVVP